MEIRNTQQLNTALQGTTHKASSLTAVLQLLITGVHGNEGIV